MSIWGITENIKNLLKINKQQKRTLIEGIPDLLNVQIQTTSVCNAKCCMCPYPESWHHNHPGYMSEELFDKILADLKNFNINKFCLYLENEPFLDKRLLSRIEKALTIVKCKVFEISTNASARDYEFFEKFVELLKKSENSELWISFHGISQESYENIMGISFNKSLRNVIDLLKLTEGTRIKVVLRGAGKALEKQASMPFHFEKKDYKKFWEKIFIKEKIYTENIEIRYLRYHDRAGTIKRNEYNYKRNFQSS